MKEKLGIIHLVAIVMTAVGVVFISKPSFLFGSDNVILIQNQTAYFDESVGYALNNTFTILNGTINQTSIVLVQKAFTISPGTFSIIG